MSVIDVEDVTATVAAIRGLGDPAAFEAPYGYPESLALCIIDSIWSIGVRYKSVENVIDRYRAWVSESGGDADRRTASGLVDDIESIGGAEAFAVHVVRNRQLTSTRAGVSKAEAVLDAARKLASLGVEHVGDLRSRVHDDVVKSSWLSVHGQRSGVSWYYLTMLAAVEDVKPDRMVMRFLTRAVGRSISSPAEARALLASAHQALLAETPTASLRAIDYVIWSQEARASRRRRGTR